MYPHKPGDPRRVPLSFQGLVWHAQVEGAPQWLIKLGKKERDTLLNLN